MSKSDRDTDHRVPPRSHARFRNRVSSRAWLGTAAVTALVLAGGASLAFASIGGSSSLAKQIAALLHSPTTINQKVPLKHKPPAHGEIDFIGGTAPQVTSLFDGVKAAGAALGWTVREIPGYNESDPASYVAALDTALQHKPVAVIETAGVPESEWAQVLPAYKAAHTVIVPAFGTGTPSSVVTTSIPSTQTESSFGVAVAKWVAYQADGQAKKIMLWDIPAFTSEPPFVSGFEQTLAQYCSACTVTPETTTLGEFTAGTTASVIVSALRQTNYNYFVSAWGEGSAQVSAQLGPAGITGLTIASNSCDTINEAGILNGTEALCTAYPYQIAGWIAVDTVLRRIEKMNIPSGDGGFPAVHLLTSANESSWSPGDSLDQPINYPEQFKKLWHVK